MKLTLTIDLHAVAKAAHTDYMAEENDLRWALAAALEKLHPELIEPIQAEMSRLWKQNPAK